VLLRCLRAGDQLVRIEVLDTGIGIPADQLPYIYDEFYQVGVPTNSSRDGYGLGLSIVQRLVKLLNLGFDVRSEVGKGSTFAILLPASAAVAGTKEAPPREAAPADQRTAKAHVLLVEDEPGVRDATRMLLKIEGYRVTAVGSLAEATQAARADPAIDLLLTDYHLGAGETGSEVIRVLREILDRPLKAVLMSGDTSAAVRGLPVDSEIRTASKPIRAEELLGLIRGLLANPGPPPSRPGAT